MFSLELPGTLTSKKSSDSLHLDESITGVNPLEDYAESPRDRSRRGEGGVESRKHSTRSPAYHGVEFGDSPPAFGSPDEYMGDDGPLNRRRGLSALGEAATSSVTSMEYYDDRSIVADFLRQYHCTSMMPQSSKVVVLDNGISIRAAFHALSENDIDSATVWDASERDFVGVITFGDLLAALLFQFTGSTTADAPEALKRLETTTIKHWMSSRSENRDLVCVEPTDTLFEALSMLSRFKVHRVPVIDRLDQNTILYVLTATKIVVFLMKIMAKRPALFETSLEKIQIGKFDNLTTATPDTSLLEVLHLIEETHFSAIPVVDQSGKYVDMLYKSELARINPFELLASASLPVAQVLSSWRQKGILRSSGVNSCTIHDSLEVVLTRLMDYRLRSLVVVDSNQTVKGIIALTDILRCFIV